MQCSKCGQANPAGAKFCAECGQALVSTPRAAAERRQLTVMFCDLVGSTALSARIDPEELRDVLREYQALCTEEIQRFGGSIVQYLGDGLLVYFGVPQAHEDDARRAGHAGMAILRAMAARNARLAPKIGGSLAVRVGIHTGPVVVGDPGAGEGAEYLAVGETPNVAARLQGAARPNSVVISETTHRLVASAFECSDLGSRTLAGVPKPMHVYELTGERDVAARPHGAAGSAGIVGRREELGVLVDAWRQACAGTRRTVLLSGEPGIGKSRLVDAVKAQAALDRGLVLEGHCLPFFQTTAFYSVIQLLGRWLAFAPDDAPDDRRRRLERALDGLALPDGAVPLVGALVGLPFDADRPGPALPATVQRQRTIDALVEIPRALSADRPVLLLIEDLHWTDPSTLEVLDRLAPRGDQPGRLMVLLTCRPEFDALWKTSAAVRHVPLGGLDAAQAEALVRQAAGGKLLPPPIVAQIIERADGIPLFIEETTNTIIESGALGDAGDRYDLVGPLPSTLVPMTLRDALMARLDRLGAAKGVVQLGATIGRDFSFDLLEEVAGTDAAGLRTDLARAVASGLLQELGATGQTAFVFKHSLVQDTAYESLLRKTRQGHHQRIAAALEGRFVSIGEQRPELLAHHHTEAGNAAKAIRCWHKAGTQAIARAAFAEAAGQLTRGVRLIEQLPAGVERDREELALQSPLGIALQAHRGYSAPEVDEAYVRARELCRSVGDSAQLVAVLRGRHFFYGVRADYGTAMQVSQELLDLADREANPAYQVEAHLALGLYAIYLGEFVASRRHLETGLALYDSGQTSFASFNYLGHSAAICYSYLGRLLSFMGHYDFALSCSERGLALAETLAIPMSRVQALGMQSNLFLTRGEYSLARDWAARTFSYATEHGFPYWSSLSSMYTAWLRGQDGELDRGIAEFRQGLERYVATGARLGYSWFLLMLAELYGLGGRWAEAFDALDRGLAHVDSANERYYEAELYRLRGDLRLLQQGRAAAVDAETCFVRALEISERQQAQSWTLRAATSLARLWRDQGRTADAAALLGPTYGWFTEGLDLPDLKAARELLDSLHSEARGRPRD